MKRILTVAAAVLAFAAAAQARHIRANQAGYLPSDAKIANLFSNDNLNSMQFSVIRKSDSSVVLGPLSVGANLGAYSGFANHYRLNFSALTADGIYFIRLSDGATVSYDFEVGECAYRDAAAKVLNYIRSQRCGFNPYLNASCHAASGTGRMDAKAVNGPASGSVIDASGGWHDAGDYIKFMINEANMTYMLLLAYRENPSVFADEYLASGLPGANGIPDVLDEAKYGLDFMMKMHPSANVLYYQVADATDHNTWRLPQNDAAAYSTAPYRTLYHCDSGKGANIAGKASAAFALAYEAFNGLGDTAYAAQCLTHAEQLYNYGKNNPAAQPSTPTDFYNESTWMDDMELAAAELYTVTGTGSYLSDASGWAPSVSSAWGWSGWDSLNFYAHYALYPNASASLKTQLRQFMQYDMNGHQVYANADLFGIGADYVWGSMALNTCGVLNGYLYRKLFGETTYDGLATGMRDYLLGRNQWGVSFVVGIGADYPNEPHHQIAAILDSDITGMTIEGPVSQANWNTYGAQKPLPAADQYNLFQSSTAVYYDYTYDYSTNEPTIWQAGVTLAMFSFLSGGACFGPTATATHTQTPGGPTATNTFTATATATPTATLEPSSGYIIDDFEDNDLAANLRGGAWYDYYDGTGSSGSMATAADSPSGGGTYSLLLSGSVGGGVDTWPSIGAGTNLNAAGTPENLNSTTGLKVSMKGAEGTGTDVEFTIQIVTSTITDYSYWAYTWTPQPGWSDYTIPWTSFVTPGWGQGNTMTRTQALESVISIAFSIADTTGGAALNTGNSWSVDNMEIYGGATPTHTNTASVIMTFTPSGTYTETLFPSFTATDTRTPSVTHTHTGTSTRSLTETNSPTCTYTDTQTYTFTQTATRTMTLADTGTFTETETPVPGLPTWTSTHTHTITNTPADTLTATATAVNTATDTFTAVNTATRTNTPVFTATNTDTAVFTGTPTYTATWTHTAQNTATSSFTAAATATYTNTPANTATRTHTAVYTATPSATGTNTSAPSFTPTASNTSTLVPAATGTFTSTATVPAATATEGSAFEIPPGKPVVVFPHPASSKGKLYVWYEISRAAQNISFKIYTVSFRFVREYREEKYIPAGEHTEIIEQKYLAGLGRGTYYYVLNLKDKDGYRATSKIGKLIILE